MLRSGKLVRLQRILGGDGNHCRSSTSLDMRRTRSGLPRLFAKFPGSTIPLLVGLSSSEKGKVCVITNRFVSFEVELKVKAGTAKESVALALEMLRAAGFEVLDPCR